MTNLENILDDRAYIKDEKLKLNERVLKYMFPSEVKRVKSGFGGLIFNHRNRNMILITCGDESDKHIYAIPEETYRKKFNGGIIEIEQLIMDPNLQIPDEFYEHVKKVEQLLRDINANTLNEDYVAKVSIETVWPIYALWVPSGLRYWAQLEPGSPCVITTAQYGIKIYSKSIYEKLIKKG